MEQTYKIRHRVNFSVSVKGIVSPDVTAEVIDGTIDQTIKEAKELLEKAMQVAEEKSASNTFSIK